MPCAMTSAEANRGLAIALIPVLGAVADLLTD
jgi:hypothetical protein